MKMHIQQLPDNAEAVSASVLWVPSEQVVVHRIPQPTAPKRKWAELVAWQLEDRLLQRVEDMHFVIIGQNDDTSLNVLAVSKQAMRDWLTLTDNAQLTNFLLIPDFLALPWEEGCISVAPRDELLLVRSAQFSGFAASPDLAWDLIESLLSQEPAQKLLCVSLPLDKVPEGLRASAKNHPGALDWDLAKPLPAADLLRGEFRRKRSIVVFNKWWAYAAVLLISLGLSFAYLNSTLGDAKSGGAERQEGSKQSSVLASNSATSTSNNNPDNSLNNGNGANRAVPAREPRIQVDAELLGVVISPLSSSATIKLDGQPERVFHLDDEISQGQKVTEISPVSVTIEERGQSVQLSLKKYVTLLVQEEQAVSASGGNQDGFALANMFAAVPVQVDNFDTGLKLDSLSEEMKMLVDIHEGDVVVQIGNNGIQELMSEPDLWTSYSTETEVPVTIIRNGEELVLTVNVFSLSAKILPNIASELIP